MAPEARYVRAGNRKEHTVLKKIYRVGNGALLVTHATFFLTILLAFLLSYAVPGTLVGLVLAPVVCVLMLSILIFCVSNILYWVCSGRKEDISMDGLARAIMILPWIGILVMTIVDALTPGPLTTMNQTSHQVWAIENALWSWLLAAIVADIAVLRRIVHPPEEVAG